MVRRHATRTRPSAAFSPPGVRIAARARCRPDDCTAPADGRLEPGAGMGDGEIFPRPAPSATWQKVLAICGRAASRRRATARLRRSSSSAGDGRGWACDWARARGSPRPRRGGARPPGGSGGARASGHTRTQIMPQARARPAPPCRRAGEPTFVGYRGPGRPQRGRFLIRGIGPVRGTSCAGLRAGTEPCAGADAREARWARLRGPAQPVVPRTALRRCRWPRSATTDIVGLVEPLMASCHAQQHRSTAALH